MVARATQRKPLYTVNEHVLSLETFKQRKHGNHKDGNQIPLAATQLEPMQACQVITTKPFFKSEGLS